MEVKIYNKYDKYHVCWSTIKTNKRTGEEEEHIGFVCGLSARQAITIYDSKTGKYK